MQTDERGIIHGGFELESFIVSASDLKTTNTNCYNSIAEVTNTNCHSSCGCGSTPNTNLW